MIVIKGESREALERKGNRAIDLADNWCKQNKLEISVPKSGQILLKGDKEINMERRRPTIRLRGTTLQGFKATKYLGVTLATGQRYIDHLARVANES
ncbi:unnamed protein product [Trichogramma brassicae]|uniref:Reverse transcriptase domain-containing protein n=1 Tax=Trichogramma brassicae TaxID=86971 RepID=A0A6H5J072_9HYME|nr:unnamed protein product [Trichogramma brassicae]